MATTAPIVPKIKAMPPPGEPESSRINRLRNTGSQLITDTKQKGVEAVGMVKDKAGAATQKVSEMKSKAVTNASNKVTEAKGTVKSFFAVVQDTVQAARTTLASSYETLRSKGVRAWAAETKSAASKSAKVVLDHLVAHRDQAFIAAQAATEKVKKAGKARINSAIATARRLYGDSLTTARKTLDTTKSKAVKLGEKAKATAKDGQAQATVAGAAGGAVVVGTGGAITGLTAGAAMGAAVGLVPAIFTFGLSIPIGAAIGGGAGLCTGAAAGATVGALGGGAAGQGAFAKRGDIRQGAQKTLSKVSSGADLVKGFVKEKAASVRARLAGGA
eukprot:CAMPEP_0197655006 /NCGR_PEP_ID=MMETSP1338-20131121/39192_1 /TAXON_ID=43686 ORGANISM="Pelagodinium beii, Strain RCC1491" /NCGR_SAMPLE_ID=MMETSP1338 /ASSEMBLY_ACC=CAM_ASM_000754 /LENGTH=330 /DNA_ID=CAMNT_0043230565 /DNA_START=39 /DNA_END=1031 /DNA_ORIENTATION=-